MPRRPRRLGFIVGRSFIEKTGGAVFITQFLTHSSVEAGAKPAHIQNVIGPEGI